MPKSVTLRVARLATIVVLITAAVTSCGLGRAPHVTPAHGLGSMTFTGGYTVMSDSGLDSLKVDSILEKVAMRSSGFVLAHGRSDVRRLIIGPCNGSAPCTAGPLVRIIPHNESHMGDSVSLASGKVVAKLVTVTGSPHQVAYAKFAIAPGGTSYEYIEKATVGGREILRSVFVPANRANWRMARWRQTAIYYATPEPHARARFLWNDLDDEKWGTCMSGGCCAPPSMIADEI